MEETEKAIRLSRKRLSDPPYRAENVIQPEGYGWPGDWEGRALLAKVCHERIGCRFPDTEETVRRIVSRVGPSGHFGPHRSGIADEQQLSGHNWILRGLIGYAELRGDRDAAALAKTVFENLYLPILPNYDSYPLGKIGHGSVSGNAVAEKDGWILSSDVGCAFMCVDGISGYYGYSRDERAKKWLDKVIAVFTAADPAAEGYQTHTTLTCLRGILRTYLLTGDPVYLKTVLQGFETYETFGMTLTYENMNWFGRPDSWTEPCAVTDSVILAGELYRLTGEERYRTLARRIWFNGLQFCQRLNGGAGPNSCVTERDPVLRVFMYEAPFCCTMRYAEGLAYITEHRKLFLDEAAPEKTTDPIGRRFLGDRLIVRDDGGELLLPSCRDVTEEMAKSLRLSVLY